MSSPSSQIYSATYSNVPVFEFVTSEGPIMRRKSDSWINATHILKIAKFPKARRTRILEKDIQTGIHDKVQGGYGKYQGTYVPLEIGAELARTFGVYAILQPIFDFVYVEGRSETPPPAPKHNHASASNIARRQGQSQKHKRDANGENPDSPGLAKRMKSEADASDVYDSTHANSKTKPKRVALVARGKPPILAESRTVPIAPPTGAGPSFGTFSSVRQDQSFSGSRLPPLLRQDTERDALSIMASNMNVRQADLEADHSDGETNPRPQSSTQKHDPFHVRGSDEDEFMSGKELFGSRAFNSTQSFHARGPQTLNGSPERANRMLSLNGSISGAYAGGSQRGNYSQTTAEDVASAKYFDALLEFLMEESGSSSASGNSRPGSTELPEPILNPPQPLSSIRINRPVDEDGNTIFHWACSMANVGIIEFLLSIFSDYIDSGVTNYNGETPLMFLVQFRNSFQMNNFPVLLDMLFDSFLAVDKLGRTVLHHIALACDFSKYDNSQQAEPDAGFKARKERFVNYYFEIIFAKIVGFPDYHLSHGNEDRSLEEKKELVFKFINHQDNNGNTAFHIVAHNMSKKCIRTFISFHRFIDLSLRNHVNYSVEDYLASHNYLLRLENDGGVSPNENGLVSSASIYPMNHTQSFEGQLQKSRMALSHHNTTIHLVTEKLSELSYSMEKELKQKDEKLEALYRFSRIIGLEKFKSQKAVLQLFNLHYLVEDIAKDFDVPEDDSQSAAKAVSVIMDSSRDKVIQEEVSRLMNDSTFQKISTEDKLEKALARFEFAREKLVGLKLRKLIERHMAVNEESDKLNTVDLAIKLQKQISRRRKLSSDLYKLEYKVPLSAAQKDEFKENWEVANDDSETREHQLERPEHSHKSGSRPAIAISEYPSTDKLYKYCKLVALSCGMSMSEAEGSINLIKQSLAKNANGA